MPDRLPLRVLVKGASINHEISAWPLQREHFFFPRVLERELLAAGVPVDVWNHAVASHRLRMGFATWEAEVKAWSPDVIVTSWGQMEALHLFLPRWLERHANSLRARPGFLRDRYRAMVLRPAWKLLSVLQQRLDAVVGGRWFRWKARQVARDMKAYIDISRKRGGHPLFILMEFDHVGARGRQWFPGMPERTEMLNAELRRLAASYDSDDVVLMRMDRVLEGRIPPDEEARPDGFHYSPRGHEVVGQAIAQEVLAWLERHPRLLSLERPAEYDVRAEERPAAG
jgi:hypothetical protein